MATPPDTSDPVVAGRLDSLLRRWIERSRRLRHGLLGISAVDGPWAWQGAHGDLDEQGTPATTRARYPIASVTKLFTATAVLLGVEQGRWRLEDRLVDLLPHETTRALHVTKGLDLTDKITLAHLLDHTSGLPDYYEEAPRGARSPQARLLAGEDAPVPFDEVLRLVREDLTPHFPPQPPDSPRVRARYADTNYQLLGAALEQLHGRALAEVFDEAIFAPLGLDDTSSYPHAPRSGRSPEPDARIWSKDTVLRPDGALRHQVADGGIVSTLDDQLRFLTALVSGGVFQDPATWPRMQRRFNRVFFPVEYGLGVMRYAPPRWMSPTFAVPPVVGHTGSTATWLFHCPDLGVVLAGTFDVASPPVPFRFLPRVLRLVAQRSRT